MPWVQSCPEQLSETEQLTAREQALDEIKEKKQNKNGKEQVPSGEV